MGSGDFSVARLRPLSVLPLPRLAHGSGLESSAGFGGAGAGAAAELFPPLRRELPWPWNADGGATSSASGFFGALLGSNGTYLKPKKNLPWGTMSAPGTLRSPSMLSGVMIRAPLLSARVAAHIDPHVAADLAGGVDLLNLLR